MKTGSLIEYRDSREFTQENLTALYVANGWSAAERPDVLYQALLGSHSVWSAWDEARLVGIGNAISDGHLVVYYPHLLVLPEYQRQGIGAEIMRRLMARYAGFHMQILVADGQTLHFYRKCGFERAGQTESMWIYAGSDH